MEEARKHLNAHSFYKFIKLFLLYTNLFQIAHNLSESRMTNPIKSPSHWSLLRTL